MQTYFSPCALLPDGWAHNVRLTVANGTITAVQRDTTSGDAIRLPGTALPGMPNLHSHAFQRGMAGLAQRGGDFWSWRDLMYRFQAALSPEDTEALAALAYMEMLEAGFTAVGEFHYLHHAPDGKPYANPAELSVRVVSAAEQTGIGLTLLPVFYAHGGFGAAAPAAGQYRFVCDLDQYARLLEAAQLGLATLPDARLGVAPHSLRAVSGGELRQITVLAAGRVVHIHVAEQVREVEECLAATGVRPVEHLLAHAPVDKRWCIIHATHMNYSETSALAATGAVAGLCPITEADLGDGCFPAPAWRDAGGRFGVGTDSNTTISATQELRMLEYSQRLHCLARNVLAPAKVSTGRYLWDQATISGAQALDRRIGTLAPGCRADIVVTDPTHPALIGRSGDLMLDALIFAASTPWVSDVIVGGRHIVREGRHVARERILAAWRNVARHLME
jgi:formimidoylglutamate deiminase